MSWAREHGHEVVQSQEEGADNLPVPDAPHTIKQNWIPFLTFFFLRIIFCSGPASQQWSKIRLRQMNWGPGRMIPNVSGANSRESTGRERAGSEHIPEQRTSRTAGRIGWEGRWCVADKLRQRLAERKQVAGRSEKRARSGSESDDVSRL